MANTAGAQGGGRYRFGRRLRVTREADFTRTLKGGRRWTDRRLVVWIGANGTPYPRLGLMVGRKLGNAVVRHRLKRVVREAFRLLQHELPGGWDFLVAPRVGVTLSLESVRNSLRTLAARAFAERGEDLPVAGNPAPAAGITGDE